MELNYDNVGREILIGCNSLIWQSLSRRPDIRNAIPHAIGHKDVKSFTFEPSDRVWILSYSRISAENFLLLGLLKSARVRQVVYFSSAATNVTRVTRCYRYPSAKTEAANYAKEQLNAAVVLLGLVYSERSELPGGKCAAVSIDDVAAFLLAPPIMSSKHDIRLFCIIETPFGSILEKTLHAAYSNIQRLTGRFPCILRPVDLILRMIGWRWYGYQNLSSRLWNLTTS